MSDCWISYLAAAARQESQSDEGEKSGAGLGDLTELESVDTKEGLVDACAGVGDQWGESKDNVVADRSEAQIQGRRELRRISAGNVDSVARKDLVFGGSSTRQAIGHTTIERSPKGAPTIGRNLQAEEGVHVLHIVVEGGHGVIGRRKTAKGQGHVSRTAVKVATIPGPCINADPVAQEIDVVSEPRRGLPVATTDRLPDAVVGGVNPSGSHRRHTCSGEGKVGVVGAWSGRIQLLAKFVANVIGLVSRLVMNRRGRVCGAPGDGSASARLVGIEVQEESAMTGPAEGGCGNGMEQCVLIHRSSLVSRSEKPLQINCLLAKVSHRQIESTEKRPKISERLIVRRRRVGGGLVYRGGE